MIIFFTPLLNSMEKVNQGNNNLLKHVTYIKAIQKLIADYLDEWTKINQIVHDKETTNRSPNTKIRFSLDDKQIAFTCCANPKVCDTLTGKLLYDIGNNGDLKYCPNHKYIAFSKGNNLLINDVKIGLKIFSVKQANDQMYNDYPIANFIYDFAFSPNTKQIATSGCDNVINIWDGLNGKLIHSIKDKTPYKLAYSSDSKYLAYTTGRIKTYENIIIHGEKAKAFNTDTIKVYDVNNLEIFYTFTNTDKSIKNIVFSPTNNYLAIHMWDSITIIDIDTKKILHEFSTSCADGNILNLIFTLNGKYLIFNGYDGNRFIKILNLATGLINKEFIIEKPIYSISISPNGQYIAAGNDDGTITIWDINVNKLTHNFVSHNKDDYISDIAFSHDGKKLASSGSEIINIWENEGINILEPIEEEVSKQTDSKNVSTWCCIS